MKKCILIDLDGTLANIDHRRSFLAENNNWVKFNSEMANDKVNIWCHEIIDKFRACYKIIIITGREDSFKEETVNWLLGKDIYFDEIFFRKKGDYRDDSIIKKEILSSSILGIYDVLFVVDDRKKVVDMWRGMGLTCLQCDVGDF